jgi:hypothetical protein
MKDPRERWKQIQLSKTHPSAKKLSKRMSKMCAATKPRQITEAAKEGTV